ncbi:MAG: Lsr2 family protein [Micropruina sp.]|uniref:histone-like nucleoid-structuring protein Lsr2 n=1 Tax=Micropruina sp. TaxID=2737536 RepID=UPI0039E639D6
MARQTVVTHIDDIDGTPAAETLTFAIDGVDYEIDLSEANAMSLREGLRTYTRAGRRTGAPVSRPSGRAVARTDKEQLDAMRRWARENGYEVSDRGRISNAVRDAYNSAK